MTTFLIALAVLISGYFIYGLLVERVIGCNPKREMPCYTKQDGIDYMPLPTWKVFLIQFLNIAGLGPIFGAIMGIMYGPAAFLWIVLGTIFAGAVHDFLSGEISIRMGGASLPEIVGSQLGNGVKQLMRGFSLMLMVLVGAVFVLTPAGLIAGMTPDWMDVTFWIAAIFIYYILATLLPIDKLIGNLYPVFGFALLFMAAGIMGVLIFSDVTIPDGITQGLYNRSDTADTMPLFPMMFVSIACGAISGFHATQSPMMARCLKNEKLARPVFYGAMVTEGIVALIWAAAAIAFTGGYENLGTYLAENGGAGGLVHNISLEWLGTFGGALAILGVIAAPITSGDTALRSARLIAADFMNLEQKTIVRRLAVSIPIFVLTFVIMQLDFNILWRYFAWCNQTLAVFTLWACTVYLAQRRLAYWITMLPAMFMTCVCTTYILFAPEGFGIDYTISVAAGLIVTALAAGWFIKKVASAQNVAIIED
ncbi:MAG: carbon starvation protein A [Bacteroides sp.]|nr:carbon starvation protein A [Bacteroides sp.]MCM1389430.1 carbon starvation protein A [Bacteroides sp.]